MVITLAVLLSFVLASSVPSFAWGAIGHMAVAYVAYQQLTPAVKARVDGLLRRNPDYKKWVAMIPSGTSASDKRMMLFMIAATWPDQIRSEPGYSDDGSEGGNIPDGATSSQNIGYQDKLHHKYWHFVDTPFTQDGSALPDLPSPNAGTQIPVFRAVLASDQSDDLKSYDVVWLLHLVGDVHQPLHNATRVSATDPKGDRGGNNVMLCAAPCKNELHGFWDDLPGSGNIPKTAIAYGKKLSPADSTASGNMDVAVWVKESFDDATTKVYVAPPIGAGDGPFTLTPEYRAAAQALAAERIALAGTRLASILNHELQ